MAFAVKEIFYTLQGEGANVGRAAVFCRFAGCNLWTGLEEDRASAACNFCDTDFVGVDGPGGGRFQTAEELADAIASHWLKSGDCDPARIHEQRKRNSPLMTISSPKAIQALISPHPHPLSSIRSGERGEMRPLVVCTGGEPLLQMDEALVDAIHARGFEIAVETNGTKRPPRGIDWITVSPKAGVPIALTKGHELKLIFPQAGQTPTEFEHLDFRYFFLQPMDGPGRERNTALALRFCLDHPRWRLSLQTHKLLNIP